jgi:hypothetical protein
MRRPLKPFVTEYKTGRKAPGQLDHAGAAEPAQDGLKVRPPRLEPDQDESYEAALRAADALFRPPAEHGPKNQCVEGERTEDAPSQTASPLAQGGRILRVIDEEPLSPFAELEARHAPKRRGRKPGSKNKPKAAGVPAVAVHELPILPLALNGLKPLAPATGAMRPKVGRADRFWWVRDRLRPGEEWKRRRLPRICW